MSAGNTRHASKRVITANHGLLIYSEKNKRGIGTLFSLPRLIGLVTEVMSPQGAALYNRKRPQRKNDL